MRCLLLCAVVALSGCESEKAIDDLTMADVLAQDRADNDALRVEALKDRRRREKWMTEQGVSQAEYDKWLGNYIAVKTEEHIAKDRIGLPIDEWIRGFLPDEVLPSTADEMRAKYATPEQGEQ